MTSREKMLKRIRQNKPNTSTPLKHSTYTAPLTSDEMLVSFQQKLEKSGAVVTRVTKDVLEKQFKLWLGKDNILIHAPTFSYTQRNIDQKSDTAILNTLTLSVLEGKFGVAENGAIWLDENAMPHRAIPFITQDLVLTVQASNLVANMHEAYQKINIAETGYGVFISGPSKTADIEQSLVIGAHGAKSLQVMLIMSP